MINAHTSDGACEIAMARPQRKNALTLAMYAAMTEALEAAGRDDAVRAVLIRGEGGSFTSGNDLGDFMQSPPTDENSPVLRFLAKLSAFDKPLVAAVEGHAIGIGTTMLLHCDLVYAAPSARFKTPFVDLALVPEAGSSVLLPALVGARRAAQLLLLGEQLDAQTALAWGLINSVVDDPDAAAAAAARKLASCAPGALRATRALTRRVSHEAVLEAMRVEGEAFAERLRSPE